MFLRKSEPVPVQQTLMMNAPKVGMVLKNITYQDVYEAQVMGILLNRYSVAPAVKRYMQ